MVLGFGERWGEMCGEGDSWYHPNKVKCQTISYTQTQTGIVFAIANEVHEPWHLSEMLGPI